MFFWVGWGGWGLHGKGSKVIQRRDLFVPTAERFVVAPSTDSDANVSEKLLPTQNGTKWPNANCVSHSHWNPQRRGKWWNRRRKLRLWLRIASNERFGREGLSKLTNGLCGGKQETKKKFFGIFCLHLFSALKRQKRDLETPLTKDNNKEQIKERNKLKLFSLRKLFLFWVFWSFFQNQSLKG